MFSSLSKKTLGKALITKDQPVYVQFYITARCNLTCEQCNIIYSNADVPECSIDDVRRIADNFADLGVAIVLLTGGEPFARKDLPEIIYAFESRGIHVRMQTNGFASEEQIHAAVEAGGKDISISLDSLNPALQDEINGGFSASWNKAIKSIELFTKYLPKEDSFASLGSVLQPYNIGDIEDVISFGSSIGWYTSMVPIHISNHADPRGFRTFNEKLRFTASELTQVDELLLRVKDMRKKGFLLYDSDEYLANIKLFLKDQTSTNWRRKNNNICDSPNLYFALLPNGEFAPCCDFRHSESLLAQDNSFPLIYKDKLWRKEVEKITSSCDGCMYGSYPEISISMRYLSATLQRISTFGLKNKKENWPLNYEHLIDTAKEIVTRKRDRLSSRDEIQKIRLIEA
jgi:MoaA/NifB/PqqE/SkfB family radical SAM enzyme